MTPLCNVCFGGDRIKTGRCDECGTVYPLSSLSERLRDRTTLRYMGDCKCGNCQLVSRPLLDEAIAVTAAMSKVEAILRADRKLWLWRDGDHYIAFDCEFPTFENGDPQVLGEPAGSAILKPSTAARARQGRP